MDHISKPKIISADCESNVKPKNQSKRSMSKASKAEKLLSTENCDLGNNINNPPCSQATKSDNMAPSTAKSEPDAFHLVRKSKSKKLQGLPLEKVEALRVKANQQETERHRAINQAFDQLRMLDMPYNAKLAEYHKEESKIYVVKNAADYIRDLMTVLEESNRKLYARNLPMTAYTSSGDYINHLTNASTIGMTSMENQFPSLNAFSVGNHFTTSLTAAMGSVVHHFPTSTTFAMESDGNHCPRSAPVRMGSVAYQPLRNLTNLQHPYQFPGHLHHSFCSSSSNPNNSGQTPGLIRPPVSAGVVVTGQTTGLMQPPTYAGVATMSTINHPTEILCSTRSSQVLYGGITTKAGTSCDQFSGNTSNLMQSLPHCSPIHQAHTSPMMTYQGLSNSTQPYTSTPVPGNQFSQWPNPQADFFPRANSHTALNATPKHSHNRIADIDKLFIDCPNLLITNSENFNDSGYLEMSNAGSCQSSSSSRRSTNSYVTFASDFSASFALFPPPQYGNQST